MTTKQTRTVRPFSKKKIRCTDTPTISSETAEQESRALARRRGAHGVFSLVVPQKIDIHVLNPLPDDKISDRSKTEQIADYILKYIKNEK